MVMSIELPPGVMLATVRRGGWRALRENCFGALGPNPKRGCAVAAASRRGMRYDRPGSADQAGWAPGGTSASAVPVATSDRALPDSELSGSPGYGLACWQSSAPTCRRGLREDGEVAGRDGRSAASRRHPRGEVDRGLARDPPE